MTNRIPLLGFLVAALVLILAPGSARAQTSTGSTMLLMYDAPDCSWCRKWDREVGGAYANSEEGRKVPLVRAYRGDKRLAAVRGLAYTPTFVLIVNGVERGRIVGYKGADFFWGELGQLLQRASVASTFDRASTAGPAS